MSGIRATTSSHDLELRYIVQMLPDHPDVRALVLQYGWNTTSYQILNPGFSIWRSQRHPGVVGYVPTWRRRVVAGAPVCAPAHVADVAREFEDESRRAGDRVVYFGAEARLDAVYRDSKTHTRILLGAQPVWDPVHWRDVVHRRASLRAQFHRVRNKGVRVTLWPAAQAERHPELQQCLREWLQTRPLPPLHFLVEPDTLGALHDRRVFVATRNDHAIGFVVASPIPARQGWLIEQFVRGANAPNGTAELMIDAAVQWMADHEAQYVTLGLAPLSHRANIPHIEQPLWLQLGFQWVRAHGRRFYNFDGLDAFKAKFSPDHWEPVFAISAERQFSPLSLHAIASAFTQGAPVRTVARGLLKAAVQEFRWLKQSVLPGGGTSR